MGYIKSISFKNSEEDLYKYAIDRDDFSVYIKELIRWDKERLESLFTEEERKEIERIIKETLAAHDK